MATMTLTKDNFDQVVESNDIVLVDFWAGWCGPCRKFGPTFEKSSEEHPAIVFGKVDTEAQQELAASFAIMSIPTLMVFRDKVLLVSQPGALPPDALEELIGKIQDLDMDDVHRQIADHQATHDHHRDGSRASVS